MLITVMLQNLHGIELSILALADFFFRPFSGLGRAVVTRGCVCVRVMKDELCASNICVEGHFVQKLLSADTETATHPDRLLHLDH